MKVKNELIDDEIEKIFLIKENESRLIYETEYLD